MPPTSLCCCGCAFSCVFSSSQLIDMPDHLRHRWTGWLSFSAAVLPLMPPISSLDCLLAWLSTLCSDTWQGGFGWIITLVLLSHHLGEGGTTYFVIFTWFIWSQGRHVWSSTVIGKLFSVRVILTGSYYCFYSLPKGCSIKSMWIQDVRWCFVIYSLRTNPPPPTPFRKDS